MNTLLRKLRGITGVAMTWAASWGLIGVGLGFLRYFIAPGTWRGVMIEIIGAAVPMAVTGLLCGAGFASILGLIERRKRLLELSSVRGGMWGILGAAVIPLLSGDLQLILITGPLGALSAATSIVIAKRAELHRLERPTANALEAGS